LRYKMSSTTPLEYRDAFVARVRQAGSMRTILNVPLQRSAAWTQVLTTTMSVDEAKSRRRQYLCTWSSAFAFFAKLQSIGFWQAEKLDEVESTALPTSALRYGWTASSFAR